ncbi:MAG TPA: response regulator, partial [Candidatus Thermoplasmatota archaeon]|nr:response regulator [Candidatus Thermoplasmatota archaeon]
MTDPAPRAPPIPPTGPSLAARDPGQAAVKRILVVDDETQIRAFLKTLLGRRTHGQAQVDDCGSAEDALKALESKRYDLVITDYKMGRLTGIDLLESARSRYPGMARILMTAYDDSTIACEAVERGSVDGFVSKPFNTKQVQTLVESLLGNHISAPPPPATAPAPATAPKPAMRPAPKPAASPPP